MTSWGIGCIRVIYHIEEEDRFRKPDLLLSILNCFLLARNDNAALAWKTSYILMSLKGGGSERQVGVRTLSVQDGRSVRQLGILSGIPNLSNA